VARTLPRDGTAGVSVRAPIAVVFDSEIEPATVEDAISITPPIDGNVRVVPLPSDETPPGSEEPRGTVLLFEPAQPLAPHTTYTVTMGSAVALAGAPDIVAAGRIWTFTTGQPTPSGHNQVAFVTARGGNRDVWLMNPDGSAQRQLTTGLAPVSAWDVTLDGTRAASASGGAVRMLAIDGTGETVLTAEDRIEYAPRFTPDGRRLLLARRGADGSDQGWWLVPLDAAAGEEVQLLPTGAPPLGSTAVPGEGIEASEGQPVWTARAAWDPTGRWLLITTGQGGVVLVDVEAGASGATALPLNAGSSPTWSPADGRFLVVGRAPDGEADALYSVGTDGTVEERGAAMGSVAVAEDGRVAVLRSDAPGVARLALGGLDGGDGPEIVTSDDELSDRWPAFSPDGSVVLFGRVREDGTVSAGIWSIDARGDSRPVRLTTDGAYPRWLP
jgi:Tol biopolymer transport system component